MFRYISKLSVWDVYLADSLKAGTGSKQGQGQLCKVLPLAPLPSTWKASWGMMRTRVNCFVFFSKKLKKTHVSHKILVSACGDNMVSLSTEADLNNMSGCTHRKASCCMVCETRPQKDTNMNCWHWRCTCGLCCWRNKGGRAVGCI